MNRLTQRVASLTITLAALVAVKATREALTTARNTVDNHRRVKNAKKKHTAAITAFETETDLEKKDVFFAQMNRRFDLVEEARAFVLKDLTAANQKAHADAKVSVDKNVNERIKRTSWDLGIAQVKLNEMIEAAARRKASVGPTRLGAAVIVSPDGRDPNGRFASLNAIRRNQAIAAK